MDFNPSNIDVFIDFAAERAKYRMCVGFAIGGNLYSMKKFGLIDSQLDVSHPTQRHLDACRRTYEDILTPGELTVPIFGYDLGEPCEYDDNGEPIGDWPQLGTATIFYTEKFMMPAGVLPEGYQHLRRMRLAMP